MKIIALEEHFTTRALREANADHPLAKMYDLLADAGQWQKGAEVPAGISDLGDGRLADMDAAGIAMQLLSQTVPATESLASAAAVRLAAEANDVIADAVSAHPDRFGGFATLPMSEPKAAADELDRAVSQLGFRGAMVNGHVGGRYLDDEFFWPVFERAEALGVPIYLHPTRPPQAVFDACYAGFSPVVTEILGTAAWGWHVDTGLHALRLIIGGVFDRFPNLQVILGHMGETLPSMIWRVEDRMGKLVKLDRPIPDYFTQNFHITISGVFDYAPFASAVHAIGIDRILFAVDYPYSTNIAGKQFLDNLPISPGDKAKIAHLNAERLLGLAK